MTEPQVIAKESMPRLLDALLEGYRVLAPTSRDGVTHFGELTSGDVVPIELPNTKRSVKEVLLPRTETLFVFDGEGVEQAPNTEDLEPRKGRVVLGVRPCDAASVPMLDKVFLDGGDEDAYYAARRRNTWFVGLGCNHPASTCFCTSVGGGPFAAEGLDILLSDLGDRYLVRVTSSKGAELLASIASAPTALLEEATEADVRAGEELARGAAARIPPAVEIVGLQAKLAQVYDDESFWEEIQRGCLGCGVCTYLCPTCHCFDVVDETNGRRGRRARIWDSCQYALFTRHASGHNPRPSGKERMRQRVMHKFRYFVDNYGLTACVGCGRCVRNCPVNMDIRQVLQAIMAR